jgi:hypothetical protein
VLDKIEAAGVLELWLVLERLAVVEEVVLEDANVLGELVLVVETVV